MPQVLHANAKLTVSLRIDGVRDDGYHLIDAEMVSLSLRDEIEVDSSGTGFIVLRDGEAVPGDPDDLVARALSLLGRSPRVVLRKTIPAGAGLGGGSSDAAAILRWAGVTDPQVAVRLGADVPFCVAGGRARVRGIGEILEPLPFEARSYTLLTAPIHCSTPRVYAMWDDMGGPTGAHGNDLEPAAVAAYPQLAAWRDGFAERTGQTPRLAGSGSTWFVEGRFPGPTHVVVDTVPSLLTDSPG